MALDFLKKIPWKGVGRVALDLGKKELLGKIPGGSVLGELVDVAADGIIKAARNKDLKTGEERKGSVLTDLQDAVPRFEEMIAKMGATINDPDRMTGGAHQVIEGLLDIMKALGVVPSATGASGELMSDPTPSPESGMIEIPGRVWVHGAGPKDSIQVSIWLNKETNS